MRARRIWVVAAGAGGAGLLFGHHLNYLLLPEGAREHVLSSTGHGYLGCSGRMALLAGVIAGFMLAISSFIAGRTGRSEPTAAVAGLTSRLVVLQGTAFVALEVGERLLSGGVGHHLDARMILLGLAIQLLLAVGIGAAARILARAAHAVGAGLRPTASPEPSAGRFWSITDALILSGADRVGAGSPRSPPLLAA